jgi:hypothetical protein
MLEKFSETKPFMMPFIIEQVSDSTSFPNQIPARRREAYNLDNPGQAAGAARGIEADAPLPSELRSSATRYGPL